MTTPRLASNAAPAGAAGRRTQQNLGFKPWKSGWKSWESWPVNHDNDMNMPGQTHWRCSTRFFPRSGAPLLPSFDIKLEELSILRQRNTRTSDTISLPRDLKLCPGDLMKLEIRADGKETSLAPKKKSSLYCCRPLKCLCIYGKHITSKLARPLQCKRTGERTC